MIKKNLWLNYCFMLFSVLGIAILNYLGYNACVYWVSDQIIVISVLLTILYLLFYFSFSRIVIEQSKRIIFYTIIGGLLSILAEAIIVGIMHFAMCLDIMSVYVISFLTPALPLIFCFGIAVFKNRNIIRNKFIRGIAGVLVFIMVVSSTVIPTKSILLTFDNEAKSYSPKIYTYKTQEIMSYVLGEKIYGVAYIPDSTEAKKFPLIIFSHGYGGNHENSPVTLKSLAMSGYAVFAFDFRGGGNNSRSDGSTTDMSVMTEKSDLNAVIDNMKKQPFVDTNNIFLFGTSQGGFVSAITASDRPNEIQGLILLFPALCIGDDRHREYKSLSDIPKTRTFMGMKIGKCYDEAIWNFDVFKHISNFTKDVIIYHGDHDTTVDISYSEKAVKTYKSANLITFRNEGHGFSNSGMQNVTALTYEYVQSHLHK